jgi:cyanate lyase
VWAETVRSLAKAVGRHKVWVTSALLGQATMSAEEAQKAASILGPDASAPRGTSDIPVGPSQ